MTDDDPDDAWNVQQFAVDRNVPMQAIKETCDLEKLPIPVDGAEFFIRAATPTDLTTLRSMLYLKLPLFP